MKTVMKKMFCLMLVAVLMVGALPFQASATDVTVSFMYADGTNGYKTMTAVDGRLSADQKNEITTIQNTYHLLGWTTTANSTNICIDLNGDFTNCSVVYAVNHTCAGGTATCAAKAVCTTCGAEYGELASHNLVQKAAAVAATCKDPGATAYFECSNCTHKEGGSVIPVSSTHTNPGSNYTHTAEGHVLLCATCGHTLPREDHSWTYSNCSNRRCNICGRTETDSNAHAWVEATCTAPRTCNTCGAVDPAHPALNHDWAAATCTAPKTCKRATCRVTEGSALGHDWSGNSNICLRNCGATKQTVPQYRVYYNLNVNGTARTAINKTYDIYTPISTVLADLNLMNITYPGRYPTWYTLEGWYTDANCTNRVNANAQLTSDITLYAKWNQNYHYEVVLKLYTNGNTNNVVKVVDAFYWVQNDGILSRDEVQAIAKLYFEPVSNAGLIVYGPYDSNNWSQYTLYPNRMGGQEQYIVQDNGTIVLYAMIHNVAGAVGTTTAKKADSTNPKTGDMIMMPAAVLGLSTSALAVMFYLNKKKRVM